MNDKEKFKLNQAAGVANATPQKPQLKPIEALRVQMGPNQTSEEQQGRIKKITDAAMVLGEVILNNSKPCADQTAALRKLRELKYTLVSAIASEEYL